MSSKLFAFNVSKKPEETKEMPGDQWVGDRIARAGYKERCTDQDYGDPVCWTNGPWCYIVSGGSGYYICDSY